MVFRLIMMMLPTLSVCTSLLAMDFRWFEDAIPVRHGINQEIMNVEADVPEVYAVIEEKTSYNGTEVPLRVYLPNENKDIPVALFIHGGGWVAGSLDTHDNMARYLCKNAQIAVVAVEYTNSPEGKFPLPLEQCYQALLWIGEQSCLDPSRLAVVGDSAGGNMTAAVCLLNRDRGGSDIGLQVLINPVTDLTCGGTLLEQGDPIDDVMRWIATQYVSDPNDVYNPCASPFLAEDLSRLPPALVILAEYDRLLKDGQRYADRLSSSGIPTTVFTQKGIGHLAGDGARASKAAQESLDVAAEALHKRLRILDGIQR
ncbi:MAG: alpha/beta hydrolase [Chlamydiales bacterium]|nr:alpha/beta hydrolase [Chlamydiales bacterium]